MSLEFISPQLATSVDHPPPRAGWIHEVKHDGYRTLLIIERGKARVYTRNGYDWAERYTGIRKAVAKLDCCSAYRWRSHCSGQEWRLEFRCAHKELDRMLPRSALRKIQHSNKAD